MKLKQLHQLFLSSNGICTDTRQIKSNQIFVALKGDNFNGNNYADEALKKGALKAIVDEDFKDMTNKIKTKDTLKTLQDLASFHRDFLQIPIIGITGSNGKTTTKRLIHTVLEQKFNVKSTEGNLNNHIGVPLSLLKLNENTEIGIIEMGANHQKEIAFLSEIAKPDFGYITNFGKAHLEGFGGVEGVIKGKSELYDFLNKHQKLAFVNADDKKQMQKLIDSKKYSFGEAKHADLNIYFKSANPFVELEFEGITIKSKLIGEYNFRNIAASVGIGYYFDVPSLKIKEAIQNFEAKDNRSQIKVTSHNTLISDAYNANPTSMEVALKSFDNYESDNKVAILGDMYELGKDKFKEHQQIAELAKNLNIEKVLFCGEIFNEALNSDEFTVYKNFEELKQYLEKHPIKKAHILIKASRGMALERLYELL
ncbi:UDP-N-acetylmuramoyl-tripeptide--D-alanyl-D-alanine ligase [Flavobacteriaceae bacterium 14752]|uniref:UDP-N-acetylmuramoyl-tripeptide--D-alanyl-D- alanine ligase n=1 Tax=Mesohalobacter salilacus TaxID=2491711 RepID=UPI000F63B152|nr:UDP-N-acetylmuramoyl-tripeptide--D-alanyl-D-alanine ligase [Flavobacteriaceae bacterium 14752]